MDKFLFLEEKKLQDEYTRYKENIESLFPRGMDTDEGDHVSLSDLLDMLVYKGLSSELKKLQEGYDRREGKSHYFIGINPPPDPSNGLIELANAMETCVSKYKMFGDGYLYTLEANTDKGYRPHVHLMLLTKQKPHRIIEQLSKFFKLKANFIDCKRHFHNAMYNEHIDYIIGTKRKEKQDLVEMDNLEKDNLGIPRYLGKINKI